MRAELVEDTTQRIIPSGFKAGDAQPVLPASKYVLLPRKVSNFRLVTFTGLKLNVMKHIKFEVQKLSVVVRDTTFHIHINMGNHSVKTQSFKIVSSFSQLPKDLQEKRNVRTVKSNSKRDSN